MDDLVKRLDRLGRKVSEVSDSLADPAALELARRRFLSAPALRHPARPARRRVAWVLAAAACVGAVGFGLVRRSAAPAAVSFQVGPAGDPGAVGAWIAATGGESLPVRFSEGTMVTLAPRAQVRVTEATARGAGVAIEQGRVEASVVHASPDTRWIVSAGPYEVRVTGTRFAASWSPSSEVFELAMTEGSVVVTGPLLPNGRLCRAGEKLRASAREGRLEVSSVLPDTGEARVVVATTPPEAEPRLVADPSGSASPAANRAPAAAADPPWRALFAAGKYADAFAAAERAGFAAETSRASIADLYALADVARYGNRPAEARAALVMARTRGAKGRSAFLLGKVAADQQGSPGEAVTWFETYLREEPGGSLAEQALGRLIELRRRSDPGAARASAERYLAAYPAGAYAKLAQSLVQPAKADRPSKVDPTEP
jgi:hypothetical protein